MANDFTITMGVLGDFSNVIAGFDKLQQGMAVSPLELDVGLSQKLDFSGAQTFFKEVEAASPKLSKVKVEYKEFTELLTGQKFLIPTKGLTEMAGAAGIATKEFTNLAVAEKYLDASKFKQTGGGTAELNTKASSAAIMKQYADITKGVQSAETAAKNFLAKSDNMTGKEVDNAKKLAKEILNLGQQYNVALNKNAADAIKAHGTRMQTLVKDFNTAEAATKRGASSVQSWGTSFANAIKQTLAFGSAIAIVQTAQRKLNEGIEFTIELNKEMVNIQVLQAEGAQTPEEINALAISYNDLAKQMGVTTIEIARGSVEWLRQGKTISETNTLLQASTMLSKLGALDSATATNYLTSTLNSYVMGTEEAISVVNRLIAVDNISATSTRELATALQYSAASAAESGVTLDKLISYIGVVSSTTRQNAESIGQAFGFCKTLDKNSNLWYNIF